MIIAKVISGGQTGADRGGLDAALACNVPIGGYCPKGRQSEDGVVPDKYSLQETECTGYAQRTTLNILNADLTIIFVHGKMTPGSKLTWDICKNNRKPRLVINSIDYYQSPVHQIIIDFIGRNFNRHNLIINVAGSRESKILGLQQKVCEVMTRVLQNIEYQFWWVPRYNIHDMLKLVDFGNPVGYEFFYGHNMQDPKACFSQFYKAQFTIENATFCCAEQYMMSEKAKLFKDDQAYAAIMATDDPSKMKQLGREVKGFKEDVWEKAGERIVIRGNYYKFSQNPEIKQILLDTGKKILVEASPTDAIWGIAMGLDNPDLSTPWKWNGRNKLGFSLMAVRDRLLIS